jgi:alkanesulfonate monooxygenase SsuD/methylene tetrahydromethanopterin reductase-like flavin-dependent oxidoreductase (luciferase family)
MGMGMGIIPAAARNVAFTAMEIATLAGLRPGRLTVSVGHGMPGWLDQADARPASPLTLVQEYIQSLRRAAAGCCGEGRPRRSPRPASGVPRKTMAASMSCRWKSLWICPVS